MRVHLDFETRSTVDLRKCGAYVYANHPTTDMLCKAYRLDDGPVELIKFGDELPLELKDLTKDKHVEWLAHNANFEFLIWNFCCAKKYGWPQIPLDRFNCTMVRAFSMGLPGTLEMASKAVGIKAEKDMKGQRIMLQLCKPRSYNDDGTPNWWTPGIDDKQIDIQAKYDHLYRYCKQDVIVETALDKRLLDLTPVEKKLWILDQKINFRGVGVDIPTAKRAIDLVTSEKNILDKKMKHLTDGFVGTCNSSVNLKQWINTQGYQFIEGETEFSNELILDGDTLEIGGVAKDVINDLLENDDLCDFVREAILLRKEASRNSTAKLKKMISGADLDSRVRGCFQYYGAASTGRWAGRRIQLQNLPRPTIKQEQINRIFEMLQNNSDPQFQARYLKTFFDSPMEAMASCIRGFLVPEPGKKYVAADFTAIEGRVLAWLANETATLQIYEGHGKIYEYTASLIYRCPISEIGKDDIRRLIGKVATLAMGYQGGVGAFQSMAKVYFLKVPDAQAENIRDLWREANPNIVKYWYNVENAAIAAVKTPGLKTVAGPADHRQIAFIVKGSFLFCRLPSGRAICYPYPQLKTVKTPWGQPKLALTYKGTVLGKFVRRVAYGGLIVENITQAVARDLLAEALFRVEAHGYETVMHIHDEIVTEVNEADHLKNAKNLEDILCTLPIWAQGLPINAAGWEGMRFRK